MLISKAICNELRQINYWNGLAGSAKALAIAELARGSNKLIVVITNAGQEANLLIDELETFLDSDGSVPIYHFPDWETLAYDEFSPHEDIISQRLKTLNLLPQAKSGIAVLPASTLLQKVCPKEFVEHYSFLMKVGDTLDLSKMQSQLESLGYHNVSEVMSHGEFAIRGSILDVFPSGSETPFRIDLFDNEVESIRSFSPDTQLSGEKITQTNFLPAKEFPLTETSLQDFKHQWRQTFDSNPLNCPRYNTISNGTVFSGIEYYLPLFFNELHSLFDYFDEHALLVIDDSLQQHAQAYTNEVSERYEQLSHDITTPILPPDKLWLSVDELFKKINNYQHIRLTSNANKGLSFNSVAIDSLAINYQLKKPLTAFEKHLTDHPGKAIVFAESTGRCEVIYELLNKHSIKTAKADNLASALTQDNPVIVIPKRLYKSFYLDGSSTSFISEADLYGQRIIQRSKKLKGEHNDKQRVIFKSIAELQPGAAVVHLEHGVGRYLGLETLTLGNQSNDFIAIEYKNKDKLYVPVTALHLISRYSASEVVNAPINLLGNEQWSKSKRKALEKAYDVAAELLGIYAQRESVKSQAYTIDETQYQQFKSTFPFEETADQQQAIDEVTKDLCSTTPMDRVVCGDVGFGKTEVAMRAAFIAVQNNQQVAILVPTTLLAEQHGQNFIDRFASWPVNVSVLSRFKSGKQQQESLEQLAQGKIDIVIGTHKLIQKDVHFKNLGLIVIDEEHRFGVRQKEQLTKMRSLVNVMTMTATPIPRTLNMALSSLRQFSIIATPPLKRLSIKTFVYERKSHIIKEAINREMHRGGQIFFLHNNVKTIDHCAEELQTWLPQVTIRVAHGQMRERELESIMADFYHQKFNVLVCTTIIETGIDIPTANTIIIDRSDKLGLAQLHQLRGRVGRSHHQAYAYLLHPGEDALASDAKKRLSAISNLGDLGAGFQLANHDLEIRGAGELLGEGQSGQMHEVGFTLYLELLNKAVNDLKSGKKADFNFDMSHIVDVDLSLPTLIPQDYLPDVHSRLDLYKRIADSDSSSILDNLKMEMIDRFGLLPQSIKNLFNVTTLKLQLINYGIKKLKGNGSYCKVEFADKTQINPLKLITLIQTKPNTYKLKSPQVLGIHLKEHKEEDRVSQIENHIAQLL